MGQDGKIKIEVYGLMKEAEFYMAKYVAEDLCSKNANLFMPPHCSAMLENQWIRFLESTRNGEEKSSLGELWSYKGNTLVLVNGEMIGTAEKFQEWATQQHEFHDHRPLPLYYAIAKEEYKDYLLKTQHDFIFLDIARGKDERLGRVIVELFSDKLPITCKNFKELCIGGKKETEKHDPPLALQYKGSIFHRIVKNGWIQGGDIYHGKGDNGWSIYGETFSDEQYSVLHAHRGILGMANKGRHSNASQFYITLQPAPWMDFKYVAFGEVVEGLDVLSALEEQETYNERPLQECKIRDCGVLDIENMFG